MDTNNRGGPKGFIRAISGHEIVYPEYSGNRLYQSLGNLIKNPAIGMVVPNFSNGDVLYLTGTATILIGDKAAEVIPRSNLAVKITILDSRFVQNGLPFRGVFGEASPYNPPLRVLVSEGNNTASQIDKKPEGTATLVAKENLTPTITRYRFKASHPVNYKPGQWVALDFAEELNMGYSHMRDDDPTSLNDDFVRTFTVSSHPDDLPKEEFEIVTRLHGPVTAFLKRQRITRSPLEVSLRGFGGEFRIKEEANQTTIPFIAGGVGITPLLGQLKDLDVSKLRLIWLTGIDDAEMILETLSNHTDLAPHTTIYFTGKDPKSNEITQKIEATGATIHFGRPTEAAQILQAAPDAQTWHLCAAQGLRGKLLEWLAGKTVLYENFDY
jgi:NAD(P)H-flavin reductase